MWEKQKQRVQKCIVNYKMENISDYSTRQVSVDMKQCSKRSFTIPDQYDIDESQIQWFCVRQIASWANLSSNSL